MKARAAAGQVFAASVHEDDDVMLTRRRAAAAALSAPLVPMLELLDVEGECPRFGPMIERMRLRNCAEQAVRLAREGRRSLFLTPDVAQAARALQRAAVAPDAAEDKSAQLEQLAMVQLRQCRDVFELLRVVAAVDASASEHQFALIVAGDGLLRALQLALKRLRGTTGAAVCMLAPEVDDAERG